jgi:copper chaperone CopZ
VDKKTFVVPNIGCDGCVRTIVNELSQQEGIRKVEGDVQTKVVTVEYEAPATWEKIQESLTAIDYAPEPA